MMNSTADERYIKILDSAREVFARLGYKGTTVDRIAKNAGISKGSIYLFFETKEDILKAIINSCTQEMMAQAERAIHGEGSEEERMYRAIYACIMFRKDHAIIDKLIEEEREFGTQVSQTALHQIDHATVSAVEHLLHLAIEQGLIKLNNPHLMAFVLTHLYDALTAKWEHDHTPLEDKELFEIVRKLLL